MTRPGPPARTVTVDGRTFERIPVRTPVLMPGDDIAGAVVEHAGPLLRAGDTVVLSESAVAIMQGRARDWRPPGNLVSRAPGSAAAKTAGARGEVTLRI